MLVMVVVVRVVRSHAGEQEGPQRPAGHELARQGEEATVGERLGQLEDAGNVLPGHGPISVTAIDLRIGVEDQSRAVEHDDEVFRGMVASGEEEPVRDHACGAGQVQVALRVEFEKEGLTAGILDGEAGRNSLRLTGDDRESAAGVGARAGGSAGHFRRGHSPVRIAPLEPGRADHVVVVGQVQRLVFAAQPAARAEGVADLTANRLLDQANRLEELALLRPLDG